MQNRLVIEFIASAHICVSCALRCVIVGYELNVNNLINPTGFDVLVVVGLLGFGCFCMTHSNRRYRKITPGTPDPFENQTPTPLPRSMQKVIAKHSPPKITPISSSPAAGSPIKLVPIINNWDTVRNQLPFS